MMRSGTAVANVAIRGTGLLVMSALLAGCGAIRTQALPGTELPCYGAPARTLSHRTADRIWAGICGNVCRGHRRPPHGTYVSGTARHQPECHARAAVRDKDSERLTRRGTVLHAAFSTAPGRSGRRDLAKLARRRAGQVPGLKVPRPN